jgi:fluoride exporter
VQSPYVWQIAFNGPMLLLLVAFGSALGAVVRHLVTLALARPSGLPWATWLVNLSGSAALGVCAGAWSATDAVAPDWLVAALLLGFLGSYTTVSSFALQAWGLLANRQYLALLVYGGGSAVGCVAACAAGWWLADSGLFGQALAGSGR